MARRTFLGGKVLFAEAVASALAALKSECVPDFSNTVLVLPGKIARQNVQKKLLEHFPSGMLLPRMITPHQLLYFGEESAASLIVPAGDMLLWGKAVKRAGAEKHRFPGIFPGGTFPADRFSAGQCFSQLRSELVAGGLSIAEAAEKLGSRGRELARLEAYYLEELTAAGYTDRLTLDRRAAKNTANFQDVEKLILAGLPDLPGIILEKVSAIDAEFPGLTEIWINNPETDADEFDQWGRPVAEVWLEKSCPGSQQVIHTAVNPVDGARRAMMLAAENGVFDPENCAIVLADSSFYKDFAREFGRLQDKNGNPLIIADPAGVPLETLRIYQLLLKLSDYLRSPEDFPAAAALIRENDYLQYVLKEDETRSEILSMLDDFHQRFTPDRTSDAKSKAASGEFRGKLDRIIADLENWEKVFNRCGTVEFLRKFLTAIYLKRENVDGEVFKKVPFSAEIDAVNALINDFEKLPSQLTADISRITQLEIFLQSCRGGNVILPVPEGALIFEGRLEMPFLLQKRIIFCGMNEGCFPDRIQSTPFLTDTIRRELGIRSNRETLVRSLCHLFSAGTARGSDNIHLIVFRQDSEKSAMRPSGILFSGKDLPDDLLLERCQYLFDDPELLELPPPSGGNKKFKLNPPLNHRTTDDGRLLLSVTDLDQYLKNGAFDFYWSRVLKVEKVDYAICEPDNRLSGIFIHAALEELAKEQFPSEAKLRETLISHFRTAVRRHYGGELPMLVKLFCSNIIQRLEYISPILFNEQNDGFEVLATEYPFGGDIKNGMGYAGAVFRGKVDRIEYHRQRKIIRIIDIKTGSVSNVISDHCSTSGGEVKFKKLQLPLYALLLKHDRNFRENFCPEFDDCRIECAYLTIPRNVTDSELQLWDSAELETILPAAEETICRLIREISELPSKSLYENPKKITNPWLKPTAAEALCGVTFIHPEQELTPRSKEPAKSKKAKVPPRPERSFETLPETEHAGKTRCCNCPEKIRMTCPCYHTDCVNCKSFNGFKDFNLITASAGTGKTYSLASRFIQLLKFGADPAAIMAVTFTKKAAGEIFDRIVRRFCDLVKEPEKPENFCCRTDKKELFELLRQLLGSQSKELQISTIDSFFMRLMQSFAPEFGIWGEISLIDENDNRFREKTLRRWLSTINDEEEENTLRELIKEADNSELGAIYTTLTKLVDSIYSYYQHNIDVASDGTLPQIEYPVWQIPPSHILSPEKCAQTVAALRDAAENAEAIAPLRDTRSMNALAKRLYHLADAMEKSISGFFFHRLDADVKSLLQSLNDKNPGIWCDEITDAPLNYVVELPQGVAELLRISMRHIRALAAHQARKKTLAVFQLITRFDQLYTSGVRASGNLTFADLPAILLSMDNDSRQALLGSQDHSLEMRLDSRFDHYMFDEFQDTSDAQMLALDPLFSEIFSTGSGGERFRSFFCVGDVKQSIYQWRGGNPELFNYVANRLIPLGKAGGYDPVDSLSRSYRSAQVILDTVNAVFMANINMSGLPEVLQMMKYSTHHSAKPELTGHSAVFEVAQLANDKDNIADKMQIVAQTLSEIRPFEKGLTVGVLIQTNDFAGKCAAELRSISDFPISIDGKISAADSMAFNLFKALLTIAVHPGDKEAMAFLEMVTFSAENECSPLGLEAIAKKLNWQSTIPLSEAAADHLFYHHLTGFTDNFCTAFSDECSDFDRRHLDILNRAAEKFSGTPDEFLAAIDKYGETGRSLANTVQFMTYHKSKGLEFDIVFLPQTGNLRGNHTPVTPKTQLITYPADEYTPSVRRPAWSAYQPLDVISSLIPPFAENNAQLTLNENFEKCCNLYVAMTRAKRALYLLLSCNATSTTLAMDKLLQSTLTPYGVGANDLEMSDEFNLPGNTVEPVKVTFSRGNRYWHREIGYKSAVPVRWLTLPDAAPVKMEVVEKASDGKDGYFVPDPARRFSGYSAKDTGTEVHELFSRIKFISDDFDAAEFCRDASAEARKIFIGALEKDSPIRQELQDPGGDCEVWREKRFLLRTSSGVLVPGAFDRVVIHRENGTITHAEIADYKSDNFASGKDCLIYSGQLNHYRHSLSQLLGVPTEKISCWIYALKLKKTVMIPENV